MGINVKKKDFLKSLDLVLPTVAKTDVAGLLRCFCFKDGLLSTYSGSAGTIVACDLDGMDFAIPAEQFCTIIKGLFDDIELDLIDNKLHIKSGKNSTVMSTRPTKGFPDVLPGEYELFCDSPDLIDAMKRVEFTVSANMSQPSLVGLAIEQDCAYSSDGMRISRAKFKTAAHGTINLQASTVDNLIKLGQPDFTFLAGGVFGALWKENKTTYVSNVLSASFPTQIVDKLFSSPAKHVAKFPETLAAALARVGGISESKDPQVIVENTPGLITVMTRSERGRSEESIEWDCQESFSFAVSPAMLIESLKACRNVELSDVTDGKRERLRFFDEDGTFDHILGLMHYEPKSAG